ncbi:MAG: tRNA preQ1(34) S-adenosylmethionine ribosyltransferase-isomerase QueA [Eubacteriales bacterium]|nr:tRNA preQ1(34) S-adenosylmethionine ribosyltransferase-isomerase QueA [Eubacteriales bacterium]
MRTSEFNYDLPEELIAQDPASERNKSRLMLLDRKTGDIRHSSFSHITSEFRKGDCLVLNDTKVIPARLMGYREDSGGEMEFVLLEDKGDNIWEVLVRPGRKAKPGNRFVFGDGMLRAKVLDVFEDGNRLVHFDFDREDGSFDNIIDMVGALPLPPYIKKKPEDPGRYQTVYSRIRGSSAAPTAGLHFTEKLLEEVALSGVCIVFLTLHVGPGTFRPVKEIKVENHKMHDEYYCVSPETCKKLRETANTGGRIIACGTTVCRVLETICDGKGNFRQGEGRTDIFIYPGYSFKAVDALITNFHLPRSTLLMLVSAFAGKNKVFSAYRSAIENRYRFYSFGDAMFIS